MNINLIINQIEQRIIVALQDGMKELLLEDQNTY